MKPYGLFGKVIEYPDVYDIHDMGAKSSCGQIKKKSGDYRGYCEGPRKDRTRRRWKRRARREEIVEITKQLSEE